MELTKEQAGEYEEYLSAFDILIGDERTKRTFRGVIEGIIGGGSLRATVIARFSPIMAAIKNAERRVRRLAEGESTKRSNLDAVSVTSVMREQGAAELMEEEELTIVMDGMELRRPGAHAQENLMEVKALEGGLVNGYRSINVLGMGQDNARGLLYHQVFSSTAPDFLSEPLEVEKAVEETEKALAGFGGDKTWAIDRGFDNDDVWWKMWEYPNSHMVVRVYHFERIVEYQTAEGQWEERYLDATFKHLQHYATIETELEVRLRGQKHAKRQKVQVELSAVPLRVYAPEDKTRTKQVWLVRATIVGAACDPWYLLTDWPVNDADSALRVFIFYRRRWAVEDVFKFIKTSFGVEDVQMLGFEAIRNLVAYAWVAAGFLFHLGLTLEQPEVRLLATLGGWQERDNRPPGKQIITRGLSRLINLTATETILHAYVTQQGDLPPFVKQFLLNHGYSLA